MAVVLLTPDRDLDTGPTQPPRGGPRLWETLLPARTTAGGEHMSDDGAAGEPTWLYTDSGRRLTDDPITWDPAGDDVPGEIR